jgi:outer membrane biogenesis lipoprotein LolB
MAPFLPLFFSFALLFPLGCRFIPVTHQNTSLPSSKAWIAKGKLSILTDKYGGTMRFIWNYQPQNDTVILSAPTGNTIARLEHQHYPKTFTLFLADGHEETASSTDKLFKSLASSDPNSLWNSSLPLSSLPSWFFGKPHSGLPVKDMKKDRQQRWTHFQQENWKLQFSYPNDSYIPSKIKASLEDPKITLNIFLSSLNTQPLSR